MKLKICEGTVSFEEYRVEVGPGTFQEAFNYVKDRYLGKAEVEYLYSDFDQRHTFRVRFFSNENR